MGMGVSFFPSYPNKDELVGRFNERTRTKILEECPLFKGMMGKKTPPCPCVSPTAPLVPRAKAGIRFQNANVLRKIYLDNDCEFVHIERFFARNPTGFSANGTYQHYKKGCDTHGLYNATRGL